MAGRVWRMAGRVWRKVAAVLLSYVISAMHEHFYLNNWIWFFLISGFLRDGTMSSNARSAISVDFGKTGVFFNQIRNSLAKTSSAAMNTLQPSLPNCFAKFFNGSNRPNHLPKIFFKFLAILQPITLLDAESR